MIAVYKCGVFLLGIGLFWLIVCANYDKLKLILSFLAGIFFQACLGIWQFLTQSSFANKWLGMAAHSAGDLGVSVVETLQGGRWLRAYGGLDHPNILGGVLAVGLLLTIGLIVEDTRIQDTITKQITNYKLQITNKFKIQNPKFLNYILLCVLCFMLCGMFFTFSRGAWAGLLVGILIMLAALIIKKDLRGQKRLLKIILLSAVLIFILFNLFQDLVLTRLSQDARLEVKSNVERVESLRSAQQLIKNNWLRGVGIGNYIKYNANLQIYANTTNTNYANKDTYVQPAHNVFLLVWAEIGIFGLLFFIGLLLACSDCLETLFCHSRPLRRSFSPLRRVEDEASEASASGNPGVNSKNTKINKKLKKRRNTFIYFLVHTANSWIPNQVGNDRGVVFGHSQAKFSLLAAITAMFFVDHWWWSLHFGVLLFWLVLGLIFAIDRDNDKTYNENII
ncbi:MAG: O-antigen ligase family protein [bacterium]|nr:O-antigen ligase family protein [bacterium]